MEEALPMRRYDRITPAGSRDLLFAECETRRQLMAEIRQDFEAQGYRQVMTPEFEFYDVFSAPERAYPQEAMLKLFDDRGRVLVARPDTTIPIARLVATRLKGYELPLRLYYEQTVFRRNPDLRGRSNEIMQMGAELIGDDSFEADIEILELGVAALAASGNRNYRLELGHAGIFRTLIELLTVSSEDRAIIREYIAAKNYAALSAKLDRLTDHPAKQILRELPRLFGGEEAFHRAAELLEGFDQGLTEKLAYLHKVYRHLCDRGHADHLIIDLGLVNQAEYYSALVYRGYLADIGEAVVSGGRYDGLISQFGYDLPAVGLAIHIDQMMQGRLRQEDHETAPAQRRLRLALTKGRLEEETITLFQDMGVDCREFEDKGRRLLLTLQELDLDIVFAKAADVITYVEHGVCDLGIVGLDTILENGGTYYEMLDLGFGACRFALAAPAGADFYGGYAAKQIATKYPRVARAFFEDKGMDVQVIKIEGSVELAPLLELADGIVDIVSSGATLRENGLTVVEDIRDISARLIVNEASMKLKRQEIGSLIERMEDGVRRAANKGEGTCG
jgi:ATP phosphoribosyltransferase regulatory subunit